MIWWFERRGRHSTIEVLQLGTGQFELHCVDPESGERTELFATAKELNDRQQTIEDALIAQGWSRTGAWHA